GLDFLGDFEVVRGLALSLQPGGLGATFSFEGTRCLIELNHRKTVSVYIFKNCIPGLPAAPGRFDRCEWEADCAFRPFFVQATHVFGKKAESGILADALVLWRTFGWNHQGHAGQARACCSREPTGSGRSDHDPPAAIGG